MATRKGPGKTPGDKKRKGRRARGTGSIFFSPKAGKWIGRKTVGKTAKGKPKRVEVWGDTQAEVVKKLAAALPPGPDTTVEQWADRWYASVDVRKATAHLYEKSIRLHIKPGIGTVRLQELTVGRVETFGVSLVKKSGLQATTARMVLGHLRTMLTAAVRDGLISANPCATARKPRGQPKRLEPYSPAELLTIIQASAQYSSGAVVALLASCGCRIGEALALDVPDIDPASGYISISKTYDRRHGIGPPKSRHSVRTIRVPAVVVPFLVAAIGDRKAGPLFVSHLDKRHIS